jgi:hypothetical protein
MKIEERRQRAMWVLIIQKAMMDDDHERERGETTMETIDGNERYFRRKSDR